MEWDDQGTRGVMDFVPSCALAPNYSQVLIPNFHISPLRLYAETRPEVVVAVGLRSHNWDIDIRLGMAQVVAGRNFHCWRFVLGFR